MGVKNKFDKLLSQVKSVEDLVQQVTVAEKRQEFIDKLKSIKQQCNSIAIPKVSVRQAAYKTSLQPMFPITGQSMLNVVTTHFKYDPSFDWQSVVPEYWEIKWKTGVFDTLIIEYKRGENTNPDYSTDVLYVKVYDVTKCFQPLFWNREYRCR